MVFKSFGFHLRNLLILFTLWELFRLQLLKCQFLLSYSRFVKYCSCSQNISNSLRAIHFYLSIFTLSNIDRHQVLNIGMGRVVSQQWKHCVLLVFWNFLQSFSSCHNCLIIVHIVTLSTSFRNFVHNLKLCRILVYIILL